MASPSDRPTINIIDCNHVAYDIADTKVRERVTAIENTGVNNIKDMAFEEKKDWTSQDDLANAITILQSNFQAGVNAVFDAVDAKGVTPASHSLSDVVTAIGQIQTGGRYMTKEIHTNGTYRAVDDLVDAYDVVIVSKGEGPFVVKFFDIDHETLLEQQTVTLGGGAIYHGILPSTSGMRFVGQNPDPSEIYDNTNCYPKFENIVYNPDQIADDQATIARNCRRDKDFYETGKQKLLELQNGVLCRMQLVGKGVDIAEGEDGYNNTTQLAMDVLDINLKQEDNGSPFYGGWDECSLKTYLNTTFLNTLLPAELKPYIKNTVKYSKTVSSTAGTVTDYPSVETIQIPSVHETGAGYETLGAYYDVAFDNSRQKFVYNGGAKGWQTRTQNNSSRVMRVNNSGFVGEAIPDNVGNFGLLIGFCL